MRGQPHAGPSGWVDFLFKHERGVYRAGFPFEAVLASKTLPNSWRGSESARFSYGFVAMKER